MKKTDRRPVARRIRELVYTDEYTLEIFRYPLNTNGSHIKKMQRAKRTNYNNMKKKVEIIINTDDYETSQNEESSCPTLENEEIKDFPNEYNFNDSLQLPQVSIEDTELIQISMMPETITGFHDQTFNNLLDTDFMIDKTILDTISIGNQNDFNYLKLL